MNPRRLSRLLRELKRRKVFRVAGVYALVAWVVIEAADVIFPALRLPEWSVSLVVGIALLGFPIALVLAWAFDVTPEGVTRMPSAAPSTDEDPATAAALATPHRPLRTVGLAAVLILALGAGWFLLRPGPTPEPSRTTIAVLPFSVRGASAADYLTGGMVELLSRNLDGAGELRTVDPGTVLTLAHEDDGTALDLATARDYADRLGAGMFLLGSVHEAGGELRIQAALYDDAARVAEPVVNSTVEGDTADLFGLVDRLAAELLGGMDPGAASRRLTEVAAVTTTSLPALKAYLDAERHLRRARFDSAIAGFRTAVERDTAFALAHYRLAVAAVWGARAGLIDRAVDAALAHADRLAARDRRLLDAFAAMVHGRVDEAEAGYRAILADYPDDVEATFQLADLLFHFNPVRGRPMSESRRYFERVLAADPEFVCPI